MWRKNPHKSEFKNLINEVTELGKELEIQEKIILEMKAKIEGTPSKLTQPYVMP